LAEHYERKKTMPRGQYDRSKSKEQRAAEKGVEKPAKLDMRVKANKLAAKATPKKISTKSAKKAMLDYNTPNSDIVQTGNGVFFKTDVPISIRMETLMGYASCLTNIAQVLAQAGALKGSFPLEDINTAMKKCLERLEIAVDEVQPLPLEQSDEPEAVPFHSDVEAYIEKHETKAPAAPIVVETPAPVVRTAPIPFNPAVPPNGS
jgi:hypothetical protein